MEIRSGIYWDKGGRSANQDSLTLQQVKVGRARVLMAVVSDGIGGLNEGENASGFIVERLTEHFYRSLIVLIGKKKGIKTLRKSFIRCFDGIAGELTGYAGERGIKLGATVSILFIWKKRYLIVHLGDSRIYWYGRKKQRVLTVDHSDGKGALTKCLGSFPLQIPCFAWGRIKGRCGFLLCTDGFYRKQNKDSLALLEPGEIEREEQIDRRLWEMAQAVLKRGEKDNLSAIYIRM